MNVYIFVGNKIQPCRSQWQRGLRRASVAASLLGLRVRSRGETGLQDMRITKIWTTTDWNTVWKNIHGTPVSGGTKVVWYKVIHDILPTNVRLRKIRISPTDECNNCGMHDKIQHRLIECGEGPQIWQWTTQKLAFILRTSLHSCRQINTNYTKQ